jgi:hypothetical protein
MKTVTISGPMSVGLSVLKERDIINKIELNDLFQLEHIRMIQNRDLKAEEFNRAILKNWQKTGKDRV